MSLAPPLRVQQVSRARSLPAIGSCLKMATETPSTQPLLRISSDSESSFDAKAPHVSLRELEDGNGCIFASDEEEIVSRPGFLRRLRMSIRRRNAKLRADEDCGRVRLPDEKTQSKKYQVKRKYAARACVIIPLLVFIFL